MNNPRLSYDIQKIIPHLRNTKILCNLDCEEGIHLDILDQILNMEHIYVTDQDDMAVFKLLMTHSMKYDGRKCDLNEETPIEAFKSDTVLWFTPDVPRMSYNRFLKLLETLNEKLVVFTLPCEGLVSFDRMLDDLKDFYTKVKWERMYPNDLDEKNTKRYLFVAKN